MECNHPDKYEFVGMFHIAISRICYEISQSGRYILTDSIKEIKDEYFTEEHIPDEQIEILLVRLCIPAWKTWKKTRDEKIDKILELYAELVEDYYYNRWGEEHNGNMEQMDVISYEEHVISYEEQLDEYSLGEIKVVFKESQIKEDDYFKDSDNQILECPICYDCNCFVRTNCKHGFCDCLIKYIKSKNDKKIECPCCREYIISLEIIIPK